MRFWHPHLVLLDYYLRESTGETVARSIRAIDELCQVLLVTGYASEQPARKLLAELDIQGYHDKADGPQRLMILVDAALKHYRALQRIDRQRKHLRHVLDVAPRICAIQPVDTLLEVALAELSGLLRGGDGFIATSNSGLFVLGSAHETVSVHAATGRFAGIRSMSELPLGLGSDRDLCARPRDAVRARGPVRRRPAPDARRRSRMHDRRVRRAPRRRRRGLRDLRAPGHAGARERHALRARDRRRAHASLHARLRPAASQRGLQSRSRTDEPTSVIIGDIDHFKRVNDTFGHAGGDLVLRAVAAAIREECRVTDVASRHGGEEFLLVLPATDSAGARVLAERIRERLSRAAHRLRRRDDRRHRFVRRRQHRRRHATLDSSPRSSSSARDDALYAAKRGGRDSVVVSTWMTRST